MLEVWCTSCTTKLFGEHSDSSQEQRFLAASLMLSGEGFMRKVFERNLESMANMEEEYEALANQLGYISANVAKRPASVQMGPPAKHSVSFARAEGASWSNKGRRTASFQGRGNSFTGRSESGSQRRGATWLLSVNPSDQPAQGTQAWLCKVKQANVFKTVQDKTFLPESTIPVMPKPIMPVDGAGVSRIKSRVACHNRRPVGPRSYQVWLHSGTCPWSTSFQWGKEVLVNCRCGSKNLTGQKCNRSGSTKSRYELILQHPVHGAQEKFRKTKTCYKFETLEQVPLQTQIQTRPFECGGEFVKGGG